MRMNIVPGATAQRTTYFLFKNKLIFDSCHNMSSPAVLLDIFNLQKHFLIIV